jgi:hypothetical protein
MTDMPDGWADKIITSTTPLVEAVKKSFEPPLPIPTPEGGRKDDTGKLPLELLPTDSIEAIAEILDFGAKKYAPRNWEKGMEWGRVYGACMRHLFAWWTKRDGGLDPDTGKSHLWHAGCCILFLIAYERRGVGTDNRP